MKRKQRKTYITIRATQRLKQLVQDVADKERRTLSYMAFLLLEEGLLARASEAERKEGK